MKNVKTFFTFVACMACLQCDMQLSVLCFCCSGSQQVKCMVTLAGNFICEAVSHFYF